MSKQNEKLVETKKRCEITAKVISAIQTIVIVGMVLAAVSGIFILGCREQINPVMAEQVASGKVTMDEVIYGQGLFSFFIDFEETMEGGDYALPIALTCFWGALICLISCIVIGLFKDIFKIIAKEETPFNDEVLKKMKISFIAATVGVACFSGIGTAVIAGLMLWCLFAIFEYGTLLQQEVDETL